MFFTSFENDLAARYWSLMFNLFIFPGKTKNTGLAQPKLNSVNHHIFTILMSYNFPFSRSSLFITVLITKTPKLSSSSSSCFFFKLQIYVCFVLRKYLRSIYLINCCFLKRSCKLPSATSSIANDIHSPFLPFTGSLVAKRSLCPDLVDGPGLNSFLSSWEAPHYTIVFSSLHSSC